MTVVITMLDISLNIAILDIPVIVVIMLDIPLTVEVPYR